MMGLDQNITNAFKNAFERNCFQLIIEAYQLAVSEKIIQLDWEENDITSELHDLIDRNEQRARWRISTNVESHLHNKNVKKEKGYASKLPRIDLRMVTFNKKEECKYYFEAKNLKAADSKLKRRYIKTGIDHFISKKYGNGSLIGYLIEGSLDSTINGLNKLLEKDNRKPETLKPKTCRLYPHYYESEHEGIGVLKHLIFDFSNNLE